ARGREDLGGRAHLRRALVPLAWTGRAAASGSDASRRPRNRSFHECLGDPVAVAARLGLGVPLQAERKAPVGALDGLHQPIRRAGADPQVAAQPANGLMVLAVHLGSATE